jgi:hypothetical protein
VWVWNRSRPDKSKAKDLPKDKQKKDPRSRMVQFLNKPSTITVDIYWDANAPVTGFEDLAEFTRAFQVDSTTGFPRFKHQGTLQPGRQLEVNSYETHVFVSVNQATKEVVAVNVVKPLAELKPEEKTADGQLMLVGA